MSTSARYRVALIGCGDIAETGHVPALLQHPRFELTALCDVRPERAALLAARAGGVPALTDYRALLERQDLHAVILALHPNHSVAVASEFLRRRVPVLDEKPLAATLAEGRRLEGVVRESGTVYQIGFVMRYSPVILKLGEWARQIGAPACYRFATYDERLDRANTLHFERIQQFLRNSSAITHEGSHLIDYFQILNPSPLVRVQALAVRTEPDFSGPNLWSAQFQTADGSALQVEVGWFLPMLPVCTSFARIAGPGGCAGVDLRTGLGDLSTGGVVHPVQTPPLAQEWAIQLDVFAEAIARGCASIATVRDGLRALAATTACEASQRSGAAVEIEQGGP